eukprot:4169394-Prymnesium_polylepis.1
MALSLCAACAAAQHKRPWHVHAQSACLDAVEISDAYPMRAPLVVADFLADKLQAWHHRTGTAPTYAEIGTRDGDCIACVAKLAGVRAVALEQSAQRCTNLRTRGGFDVVEGRLNETSYARLLPTANVYYFWIEATVVIRIVTLVHAALCGRGETATIF